MLREFEFVNQTSCSHCYENIIRLIKSGFSILVINLKSFVVVVVVVVSMN